MVDNEAIFIGKVVLIIQKREEYPIDWELLLETFGFKYLLEKYPRLIRSQTFGDDDYPVNVRNVLKSAYMENEDDATLMIKEIFNEYLNLEEEDFSKHIWLKDFLEKDNFEMVIPSKATYLKIDIVPDDFYKELIELINKCYSLKLYVAVLIFSRKMLESLIVDILRKKYGKLDINLFYMPSNGRFHSFSTLLKNFENNLNDFKPIIPSLNNTFIKKINDFRESGNSSAHTLELRVTKKDLDNKKDDLNQVILTLIRIIRNL